MIAYLKGPVMDISENRVVIEVNNIGMNVSVSARDIGNISASGTVVQLYTSLQVREDSMTLFGFLSKEDLKVFQLLLGVNGIGPKAALGILSVFSANELRFAVLAGDAKSISKAPGIGNKTAQKLILELKDKFDLQDALDASTAETAAFSNASPSGKAEMEEAVQALVALGYAPADALKAVRIAAREDDMSVEDILKAALKHMVV